jgi:SAM-dependent methyltransferase
VIRPFIHRRPPRLALRELRDQADYARLLTTAQDELRAEREHERRLLRAGADFKVAGYCFACARKAHFRVDYESAYVVDGVLTPNWRERLVCPRCGLNARMRATIHLMHELLRPPAATRLYLTEQTTPLYRWARGRFPSLVGSEWLGDDVALGAANAHGIRNEDLTCLTFPAESFELVVSLDVLEHVPRYRQALEECWRVLEPGGALVVTCPFRPERPDNLVRAVLRADGTIEHREPPEYHGNPVNRGGGALAYYHFGWELLAQLRTVGFGDVGAYGTWSREHGYLGRDLLVLVARKPAPRSRTRD